MRFAKIRSQRCAGIGSTLLLTLALAATGSASTDNKTYTKKLGPPNGVDDTVALQDALTDCAANHSSGCTIQLTAGTYLSKQLQVNNFHGALVGKGMDVTNIAVLTPLPDEWPTLLTFTDGDVTISDMSFKVTAYQPVVPCNTATDFCGVYSLVLVTGYTSANASFRRVAFDGGPGPDWGFGTYNLYAGLLFEGVDVGNPNFTGSFRMSGCRSTNSSENMRVYEVADSHVTIGGSPKDGNVFENGVVDVFIPDLARSVVDFSYNTVTNSGNFVMVLLDQTYVHDPAQFSARHNTLDVGGANNSGIAVVDYGHFLGAAPSTFVVSNNAITLENSPDGPPYDGIEVNYAQGAIASNNRVSGTASYGIDTLAANRCLLLVNNVQNLNASSADIGLLTDTSDTPNVPTTNCLVVLSSIKDSVENDGTGNIIIGGNNTYASSPAAATKDVMTRKQEMLKGGRAFATAPAK